MCKASREWRWKEVQLTNPDFLAQQLFAEGYAAIISLADDLPSGVAVDQSGDAAWDSREAHEVRGACSRFHWLAVFEGGTKLHAFFRNARLRVAQRRNRNAAPMLRQQAQRPVKSSSIGWGDGI
jgi:hypothetical protein